MVKYVAVCCVTWLGTVKFVADFSVNKHGAPYCEADFGVTGQEAVKFLSGFIVNAQIAGGYAADSSVIEQEAV